MISLKVQSKALQMLKREVVFRGSAKGAFRSIGNDVTPQIINDCYDRMVSWVKIATEALHCEWPTFEAVRAFSVFQLKPRMAPAEIRKDLKRICTIFDEKDSLQNLIQNFIECEHTASKKRYSFDSVTPNSVATPGVLMMVSVSVQASGRSTLNKGH
jgi:hypothetical protein